MGSADQDSIRNGDSAAAEMCHLHRRSNNRQIQLIAAGGSIGTAIFISIGGGLAKGGPVNLLLAFTLYTMVLVLASNSVADMNSYMPVAGGFIRLAGYWVDDALGFLAGWGFFTYRMVDLGSRGSAVALYWSYAFRGHSGRVGDVDDLVMNFLNVISQTGWYPARTVLVTKLSGAPP
ncbi:hypothetical protein NW762_009099 [Fusarium torreyae]|uniref:Amino acid permease/ SLC12A domain-containing protein n=1 Tax=Fusarium torreyae TaxID=1237075 RepID=A0A9W8VEG9_9HYPO|nr:hypothetical protein NW762_009099 [Fusarium torreyae]